MAHVFEALDSDPLGPHIRNMHMALWWVLGGQSLVYERGSPVALWVVGNLVAHVFEALDHRAQTTQYQI